MTQLAKEAGLGRLSLSKASPMKELQVTFRGLGGPLILSTTENSVRPRKAPFATNAAMLEEAFPDALARAVHLIG